ncbi:short-chain dehydrogenase [Salirhabdus sp. Marseille-P4669]|uniref:short-chain dehydrogenase n=1 Tax=Salirhabdus sp. Marseille-P4669 TaxID=2042310 RepID=UPI000C7B95E1|nr:short-chain dehydrogenase [Salirhabdus sp. Marseille-P4669]
MARGIIYTILLFLISVFLFLIVTSILTTGLPTISFFLSVFVSHIILDKNKWLVDLLVGVYGGEKSDERKA